MLLSVTASIGLLSFCGIKSTLIIVEVIPFLVLAVGVDNIFILVQAFHREKDLNERETIEDKISRVFGSIGPSLLLAALSESSCFFFGALTSMPAVRVFALNAGLALVIAFILQLTVFLPLFVIDLKRQNSNRYEILCCFKVSKAFNSEQDSENSGSFYKVFEQIYAPFLMKDSIRFPLVIQNLIFITIFLLLITLFFIVGNLLWIFMCIDCCFTKY